jgi:hypothetical protein
MEVIRQFVDRGEFCRLAVSSRKLVRSDGQGNGVRGLLDPSSGQLYVINEKDLLGPAIALDHRTA